MPVTFCASSVKPRAVSVEDLTGCSPEQIIEVACGAQSRHIRAIKQCSVPKKEQPQLLAKSNGFVRTVLQAYAYHHHLIIRPDDVWMAILSQLSFYVNAHAEGLREYFVAHQGKQRLVADGVMRNGSVDFAAFAREMAREIRKNVVDNTLVEWILPDFTTTTLKDMTICSVIMMSTLKEFFEYRMDLTCGIPTVTLEGSKGDWVRLSSRLDRLYELGDEPSAWANMLQPIIRRFVSAFDGQPDTEFWTHVVHESGTCATEYIGGWLSAFCVWSNEGKWKGGALPLLLAIPRLPPIPENIEEVSASTTRRRRQLAKIAASSGDVSYTLDGVPYTTIPIGSIPAGYCEVDVTVMDSHREIQYGMIAGHVAAIATAKKSGGPLDTLAPAPQWFMFQKTSTSCTR
ncbi:hypothetical protein C2E23DRAFT_724687 [Lenzites betulinus]|nr:hypothetical protein C2E23DRAFT_724687 [Lenzites betulinus]